jgi:hypothetical protein
MEKKERMEKQEIGGKRRKKEGTEEVQAVYMICNPTYSYLCYRLKPKPKSESESE